MELDMRGGTYDLEGIGGGELKSDYIAWHFQLKKKENKYLMRHYTSIQN